MNKEDKLILNGHDLHHDLFWARESIRLNL